MCSVVHDDNLPSPPSAAPAHRAIWIIVGVLLVASCGAMTWLAPRLGWGIDPAERPLEWLVTIYMAAGVVYLAILLPLRHHTAGWRLGLWIGGVGLVMRLIMLPSVPMIEDDWYRYLWDGAVTANGESPYRYSPKQVVDGDAPPELIELAEADPDVIKRINHPHLRTMYPPGAQAAFAISHWLRPWSTVVWRGVLLIFDIATVLLIVLLLRRLGLPWPMAVIYWWNPLLIKEVYNAAHMDVLVLPFVVGALLAATHRRFVWAAACLAVASAVKLWPIILLPLLLRPVLNQPKRLLVPVVVFLGLGAVLLFPMYTAALGEHSGFDAYTREWENNDPLYGVHTWFWQAVLSRMDIHTGYGRDCARVATGAIMLLWIVWLMRRPVRDDRDLMQRCMWAVAVMFLISPTKFPWYFIWLLPLLAVRPRWSLLVCTALLPLYHLQYVADHVVWIEHAPVWVLLIVEGFMRRREID